MEGVYLIHLNKPLSPNHTSRHYIGFATDVDARIQTHLKGGTGAARFMQVAKERNIDWVVARTWSGGTRSFERSLKNRKNASKLCPICTGKPTGTAAVYHEFLEGIKDITLYPLDGDTGEDNLETIEKEADIEESQMTKAHKLIKEASKLMPVVLPSNKKILDYMDSIVDDYVENGELNMTALAEAACEYFDAYEGEDYAVPEVFYELAAKMREKV